MRVGPPAAIGVPIDAALPYRNPFNYRTWSYAYEGAAAPQAGVIAFAKMREPGRVEASKAPAPGPDAPATWYGRPPGTKVKNLGPGPEGATTTIATPNNTSRET